MFPQRLLSILFFFGVFASALAAPPQKIIGGSDAIEAEFPYEVSLMLGDRNFCGGCIIAEQYILTAAHCVRVMIPPYTNIRVKSGSNHLSSDGEYHTITRATIHPHYKRGPENSWHHDIAVLKLTEPLQFNKKQRAMPLPENNVNNQSTGVVVGFGWVSMEDQQPSENLQKLVMNITLHTHCQKFQTIKLYKEQICALHETGHGVCSGDSGSPLVINNTVAGIASIVKTCAGDVPDIYTNVYYYKKFILEQMSF